MHSHTRDFGLYHQVDELDASSTDADADDEDTDDLRQESEDENRADGLGEICHGDDRRKKPRGTRGRSPTDEAEYSAVDGGSDLDLRHRDACGNMWSNSEVFTSVRVHVADGEAIAPIYDEYLRHLRAKGFVESWSWYVCRERERERVLMCVCPCARGSASERETEAPGVCV